MELNEIMQWYVLNEVVQWAVIVLVVFRLLWHRDNYKNTGEY